VFADLCECATTVCVCVRVCVCACVRVFLCLCVSSFSRALKLLKTRSNTIRVCRWINSCIVCVQCVAECSIQSQFFDGNLHLKNYSSVEVCCTVLQWVAVGCSGCIQVQFLEGNVQ